ncbi:aminotransferase class V-fold PLP-dependent enzyme [Candidatus Erwinia haradaeae]|uniref:aminotransferase class V-fold PLP-dependent enzyme n=1 Tax=Candidatus Erwinia haradaeae TaxID=1922217 RepID=UPI001300A401|nr:aminotransferase class V-fold PLP-dependent enzyme [Candidatus Erwinia haradaeae]
MPDLFYAITQAHSCGSVVIIDGAQGIAHCHMNVLELHVDFYVFFIYQFSGTIGIGVLDDAEERLS